MTEYIERAAAIKAIAALSVFENPEEINRAVEQERRKENEWLGGIRDTLVEIGTMDAADVRPVVLCRDCVYRKAAKVNDYGFLICSATGMDIADDDYCSYGVKKKEDEG